MDIVQKTSDVVLDSLHDGKKISMDMNLVANGQAKPVILFVHGFNGFKDWGHFEVIANHMAGEGLAYLKINLSHNGTTPARPTEFVDLQAYGNDKPSVDLDDLGVVLDYLESGKCAWKEELDLNKVFLIGHSRGGMVALLKAAEDTRIKGVVTWASIGSEHHFWTEERVEEVKKEGVIYIQNGRTKQTLPLYYACYEDLELNAERLNLQKAVASLKVPVLLIHGDADTSVSVEALHQLARYQPEAETLIIEGAAHTFGGYHLYEDKVLPEHSQILVRETAAFLKRFL